MARMRTGAPCGPKGTPQLEHPHLQDGEDQKLRAERHTRKLAPELAQLGAEAGLPPVGLPQPRLIVALGWIKHGDPAGAATGGRRCAAAAAPLVEAPSWSKQKRHDPSGFRANTADAAWPTVECWTQRQHRGHRATGGRMLDPAAIEQIVQVSPAAELG